MKLKALQRQWDNWGRSDPLWAAVTRGDRRGGGWDLAEFMRTGEDEIGLVLRHLADLGAEVPAQRALDFGCGVGRYTQAMAARFERCDGVDIAPSMLSQARELNRHPQRCHYHLNARDDLSLFGDASFSFVFSMLVLQHIRPLHAKRYLAELLRVLAPGGALVFQIPQEAGPAASSGSARTAALGPLPPDAFRARIVTGATPLSLKARELFPVDARIQNASPHGWPCEPGPDGTGHVQVANRWLYEDGTVQVRDDQRAALPTDLVPGQELGLELWFVAPGDGGDYFLELDLVQEGVAWFQERGSSTVRIPCHVDGPARAPRTSPAPAPVQPSRLAGFRGRHPALHRILRGLGLVALFRRRRRRRPERPVMEMHAVPSAEVEQIIQAGGGRLLETETEHWPNGIVSARYWVVKPVSSRPGSAA